MINNLIVQVMDILDIVDTHNKGNLSSNTMYYIIIIFEY